MKRQVIEIDINKLSTDQLEQIASMLYEHKDMNGVKTVNDRIAFINGWMSDEQSEKYYNERCKE